MLDPPSALSADDVLAQPTRKRVFGALVDRREAVGTAELADQLRLHPNGVRAHLDRLRAAGLVDRTRVRHGRGRPSDAWSVAPGALPGGDRPQAYRDLGRWLARSLARPTTTTGLERTGREIGRELAPPGTAAEPAALGSALAALGFAPSAPAVDGNQLTVRLDNCPYRDAVRENQAAICSLHQGITRGLLDVMEPGATLSGFEPRDPDRAGCIVRWMRPRRTPRPSPR